MVREHEDRHVVRRLLAPPALPLLVGPGTAHRAEHVAPEDPRADVGHAARGELVVDAGRAAVLAQHLLEGARRHEPLVQRLPADAERVVEALIRPGAVAVERDGEAVDA